MKKVLPESHYKWHKTILPVLSLKGNITD